MSSDHAIPAAVLAALAIALGASVLVAQTGGVFTLDAHRYGAGTEPLASGGAFTVEGSAGDPSVSASRGGAYTVTGGFWGALYGHLTAVDDDVPAALPTAFALHPTAPNPFNPSTTISFDLPSTERVRIQIYNLRGELVRTLLDAERPPGTHALGWDGLDENGRNVASGVYLVRLQAGPFEDRHKVSLLK